MASSQEKKSDYTYVNSLSIKPPKLIRYLNIYSKLHSKRGVKKIIEKLVADSLGCTSWVHNILTTVMTRTIVDKSPHHA